MNKISLSNLVAKLGSFFSVLFGQINWTSPPWVNRVKSNPKKSGIIILSLFAFLTAAYCGYQWYEQLPKPQLITASINTPDITPIADSLIPNDLVIDFGIPGATKDDFSAKAVAPIALIGKEVSIGIDMTPTTSGTWRWDSDSRLIFTPSQDWPAGQNYTIRFSKDSFTPNTPMEKLSYTFATEPFLANIEEFKFYQDPVNAEKRQAIATISFNYPVDSSSFEANTSLMLQALKNDQLNLKAQQYKFKITYDQFKRRAYLKSENIALPATARYLLLTINKDVKSSTGSTATNAVLQENLLIPDQGSYFKVNTATASIVRNDQDRPEQVLIIETSLGTTEPAMNKAVHAYLLPQNYPATATEGEKADYTWQNPGEVSPAILALSTPLKTETLPSELQYSAIHSYKFSAASPRYIYLKIDKGLTGFGDFSLSNSYAAIIKVPELPKEISFLHKGALLALNSEQKLSVLIRGLPAVKFDIARVLPENINQLVTQTQGDFNNPYFINQSFNQQNIAEIFSEIKQFNTEDLTKQQYTTVDFAKYLSSKTNTQGPQGLFLLQATGWDVNNQEPLDAKASRFILITDLGMVVKDNNDGSHDVFVQSITQGTPVANASVSILGKNGVAVLSRTTDDKGHVNFPPLNDFVDDREPTVYLASIASDVSFIPYNKAGRALNYSRFDTGGLYTNNQQTHSLTAYLFSDRGIYRPGDSIHLGMIVKQAYAQAQPPGLPLQVTVTDPRGTTILNQQYSLDTIGLLSLDFQTSATSPTGQYTINLFIVKDSQLESLIGSTSVRVAEFQPDRMRISTSLSQEQPEGWIVPKDLIARVGLWNLYGAPAADRKITAKLLLAPKSVQFTKYPDYIFVDPLLDPKKQAKIFTDTLKEMTTDEKGQALFDLNLDRFDKATYQLTFFAEGFEAEGGRSVTAQTTALVSPLSFLIGYKADGDLSYIKQNSQRSVNFIAVNPSLKRQSLDNLKIQLLSLHPVTTLVKKEDGTYQYQSIIQTSIVDTKPFAVTDSGIDYALPTDQIGDFQLVVLNHNNTTLSQLKFSIVGASQLSLAKNAELQISLNKEEYKPGDLIELQIRAPYTGAGLITIERDKVYASQWFKTNTTSSVQTITIPDDFKGNGYLNVTFVRDWDSPDIFISPLSYNVVPFSISPEDRALNIDLNIPQLARPGDDFKINYKTDKPGKIIVFAVDEGILQVSNYKTPDPLAFFFQKYALQVITQQTVDQILPKFMQDRELSAAGGDDSEALLANHLNPFKRKTDLPVVFWSGIIDSDETAKELSYQIPDYFNGTLRVMAVAVAENAVGSTDKSAQVRGDFVINPNVPTFVAPGDEFEITASVANNVKGSGAYAEVSVQLSTSPELEVIGSSTDKMMISEGREKTVRFTLRANQILSSATINFIASLDDKKSKIESTLSVRPATPFITSINSGSARDQTKILAIDREVFPQFRKTEAAMSSSPLILVAGLQRYLDGFPYGCTEQLTSEALPLIAMSGQSWFAKDIKVINDKVMSTIQMLGQRQMSNGSFSYWPGLGENSANTFASIYAMQFLTEARAQGYDVSTDLFNLGLASLKDFASQNATNEEMAKNQAYAIYILTRNELVTSNYLSNLQLYLEREQANTWKQSLSGAYIAASYQLLKNDVEGRRLISQYKIGNKTAESSDFYDGTIADAQYLYLIAHHFPEQLNAVGEQLVMNLVQAINNDSINTLLSGYSSLALSAYAQANPISTNTSFSIDEMISDKDKKTLSSVDRSYLNVLLSPEVKQIVFNNPARQNYFYQLIQAGFDKHPPTEALSQGIEVYREYRNQAGQVISEVKLGEEVEVHIQIRALEASYLSNIAIVDLLPGGFEVVSDSVKNDGIDYSDTREDRVVFFTSLDNSSREIIYRIKAINKGSYTAPAIFAESMYNPKVQANSATGNIIVK